MEQPQLNLDLKNTTGIQNSEGGSVFQQGLILRKISKFLFSKTRSFVLTSVKQKYLNNSAKTTPVDQISAA